MNSKALSIPAVIGELVRPAEKLNVLDDKSDNRILECAVPGNDEAIVTGDKVMLMQTDP